MSPRDHAQSYFGLWRTCSGLLGVPVDLVEAGASRNPPQGRQPAARQSVYAPNLLHGVPLPAIMTVTVHFKLS
jgi:hypothetical protein